jgi:LPS export ABC transporter protein LptC
MKIQRYFILFFISSGLISCENNIEVIRNLGKAKDLPVLATKELEILYSDSAKIKMRITSPEANRYNLPRKQYSEFPKGLKVEQYDSSLTVISLIMANYAIYHENENLWEARGNVIAKNMKKNEELNTEELFWDQTKGIIYSKKFSRITNEDGVFYGEGGFEALQDMSKWHMIGIKGKVNIKEENDAQQNP